MNGLAHVADRVIGRPLFLHPQKAEMLLWVLGERIGLDVDQPSPEANRFFGQASRGGAYRVVDGAAVVPICGSLVNRGAWVGSYSGMVSYEGITAQIMSAVADDEVTGIVLDIDSPGGEATGMFALAETIRQARAIKPVVALVNDVAASAAYGIAAQADEILVSATSIVGSIGVVLVHVDVSSELEQKGRKPTMIFSGAHKVDGNPFGPLPDSVRADLQRDVGVFYDRFVETVVSGRGGRLSEDMTRATEARTFIGQSAISRGLADRIGSLADAVDAARRRTNPQNGRSARMSSNQGAAGTETPGAETTQTPPATAQSDTPSAAEAVAGERDRIAAILGHAEAEGRRAQAEHLAFKTDMAPDAAIAILSTAPKMAVATIGAVAEPLQPYGLDLVGPVAGAESPKSGLSAAVDRQIKALR